jgi:hypothetical protein
LPSSLPTTPFQAPLLARLSLFSTAKIGDKIIYKGTDLLILDPHSHLIQRVHTWADYFKETSQKRIKICFQRDSTQSPVCADQAFQPPPAAGRR